MSTKTKTLIPVGQSHKPVRRLAGDKLLRSLDAAYNMHSKQSTSEFIERHPGASAALLLLKPQIEAHFGRSVPMLEAISDPEESFEKLRVQIVTTLPPRDAMNA